MACCCKSPQSFLNELANKASVSCLGRCDIPKHRCLIKEDIKPGPVPKNMGWHYTAKNAPEHQLRCGWRPGHISCSVLRKIERHNCIKLGECNPCVSRCSRPACTRPCCNPVPCVGPVVPCLEPAPCTRPIPCARPLSCRRPSPCRRPVSCRGPIPCSIPKCLPPLCPTINSCTKLPCGQPLIRIIRHGGQYSIVTKPSNISNAPSGPFPLKYVLNTVATEGNEGVAKYSVEAKYNDYQFDYTSSQSSFVLDFSPPNPKCYRMCPKKSLTCMSCKTK